MLVCNSYDIDTCKCSFDYIIGHNTRNKDVQESMLTAGDRIYKAHKEITTIVDKHLKEVSKWKVKNMIIVQDAIASYDMTRVTSVALVKS